MLRFILKPLKKRFSRDKVYYRMLDEIFGIYPDNIELYKLALIHKSASMVYDDGSPLNNERLEYLGDSIIESVVSDFLFIEFPWNDEGFLTQTRSKIVSRTSLNMLCKKLGLHEYLITGSNAENNKHLYGDAFEAIIGAMYLDKGYDFVNRLLINTILQDHLDIAEMTTTEIDFKSRLIEWCQKQKHTIEFHIETQGKSTAQSPVFICKIAIDGIEVAFGQGATKKEAQQVASHNILEALSDERSDEILEMVDLAEEAEETETEEEGKSELELLQQSNQESDQKSDQESDQSELIVNAMTDEAKKLQ